jgi:tetraacyldisaccharide 4'-kinase
MTPSTTRPEDRLARRGGAVELLRVPAALFGAAARLRGALYDRGLLPVFELDVPVVCVGNLTAGGTGKTPMVAWVVERLLERGRRVGLLSRGYGARVDGSSDEASELARRLPDVPHVEERDRVAGGQRLVDLGVDAIVMDDGFQHRRLARDLDLVLVDATRPWGLPRPAGGGAPVRAHLPRGLLREGLPALARAAAVVVTRSDQVPPEELARLRAELEAAVPGVALAEAVHAPSCWRVGGEERDPDELAGRAVDLVSGVGNPDAFEHTVRALGAVVHEHRRFPDHHPYTADDLAGLGEDGRAIVTTAKDAVKCGFGDVTVLEVELAIARGGPVLEALLDALPEGARARARGAYHEGLHG